MKNKFKIGEIIIANGLGKSFKKPIRALAIIENKDYYFNEYLVTIISKNKQDWFREEDIEKIMERKIKKEEKYKVALAIDKRGLDIIYQKIYRMPNKCNNILEKYSFIKEYKAFGKEYVILIWISTYWSENNFAVKCIQETLSELRKNNMAYQQIIIGETDPTYIKINEFIENDSNVNVFRISQKIEIKNMGGILV